MSGAPVSPPGPRNQPTLRSRPGPQTIPSVLVSGQPDSPVPARLTAARNPAKSKVYCGNIRLCTGLGLKTGCFDLETRAHPYRARPNRTTLPGCERSVLDMRVGTVPTESGGLSL